MPNDIWDWRRFQSVLPPGVGGVPSFTTALHQLAATPPEGNYRWDPNAPWAPSDSTGKPLQDLIKKTPLGVYGAPSETPAVSPIPAAPPSRPPSLTMFKGLPMGPQTKEAVITPPPSVPATGPATSPIPLVGPGVSTPAITGAPTRPVMPGTEFGNPATREAIRTTAPGSKEKGPYDDIMEKVKRGDFNGAISGLSQAMGNRKGVAAPESHAPQIGHGNPGFHAVDTTGKMDQFMAGLTSRLAHEAWEKKSARRRREQNRYDILGGQG